MTPNRPSEDKKWSMEELLKKIEGASDKEIGEIIFGAMDEWAMIQSIEFGNFIKKNCD